MQITYTTYMACRDAIEKAARPSQRQGMLDALAKRWPELHYEMCMGQRLMTETRSVQPEEVCYV